MTDEQLQSRRRKSGREKWKITCRRLQECPRFEPREAWGSQFVVMSTSLGQPPHPRTRPNVANRATLGFASTRMHPCLYDFDNLRDLKVPPHQLTSNGLIDKKHTTMRV